MAVCMVTEIELEGKATIIKEGKNLFNVMQAKGTGCAPIIFL